jgi:hypothetical protein
LPPNLARLPAEEKRFRAFNTGEISYLRNTIGTITMPIRGVFTKKDIYGYRLVRVPLHICYIRAYNRLKDVWEIRPYY